jgi:hypothetical protein
MVHGARRRRRPTRQRVSSTHRRGGSSGSFDNKNHKRRRKTASSSNSSLQVHSRSQGDSPHNRLRGERPGFGVLADNRRMVVEAMNETTTQVLEGVVSVATEHNDTSDTPSGPVSNTSKLALLAKSGRTDALILTLLAAEFGPQIATGLQHVPGCG